MVMVVMVMMRHAVRGGRERRELMCNDTSTLQKKSCLV